MLKLSVIIPAFNEEPSIIKLLSLVNEQNIDGIELEVVVVDDCSTDGTLTQSIKVAFRTLHKSHFNA